MDRNKEDRKFLHELATPMTVLSHVVKRLQKIVSGQASEEEIQKHQELLKRAETAIQKLEDIHANFKITISAREKLDSKREAV